MCSVWYDTLHAALVTEGSDFGATNAPAPRGSNITEFADSTEQVLLRGLPVLSRSLSAQALHQTSSMQPLSPWCARWGHLPLLKTSGPTPNLSLCHPWVVSRTVSWYRHVRVV